MNAMGSMMSMGGGRMLDMSQMRKPMFQKADSNGDQALSLDEFKAAGKNMPGGGSDRTGRAEQAFGKMDADGNGSVTQDEMRAAEIIAERQRIKRMTIAACRTVCRQHSQSLAY